MALNVSFLVLGASISVSDELFLEEQCPMEMYSLAAVQVSLHVFFHLFSVSQRKTSAVEYRLQTQI